MKFLITTVILAGICGLALCGSAEYEETLKQCSQKHNGVSMDSYKKAITGEDSAPTPDVKCMISCVGEKMKLIKDGALQTQNLAEVLGDFAKKEEIEKIASDCNLKGSDNCDSAYKITNCIGKKAPMTKKDL